MTGPEHYSYAEQLLAQASEDELGSDAERFHVAKAQVHATLALAAATALPGEHPGDWQREIWAFGLEAGPDDEPAEYDPGPEADDEGGMSEYRGRLP
jgi:hypothetical protein